MPHGLVQTWGMYNAGGTSDDLFKSDFIVVWCSNPSQTLITDMHFMHEVRYRGARLVVIAPDYSPTAVHADYWLNPRVGTDSALALAMAQVILSEGLHDEEYIREQTDLPILVREDTGRYLRESDLRENGSEELFYFWDSATDRLAEVPGCVGEGGNSLALGALRPALTGRREVRLHGGTSVGVRPLLDVLRNHLDREYTPEQSAGLTGVGAKTIRRMARELAAAPRAMIWPGSGLVQALPRRPDAALPDPADGPDREPGEERRWTQDRLVVAGRGLQQALQPRHGLEHSVGDAAASALAHAGSFFARGWVRLA